MEEKVYRTKSGKKYHTNINCGSLRNHTYKGLKLSEALKEGLSLCTFCENLPKNNKNFSINSDEPENIIFNSSTMKNKNISDEIYNLEKSIQSIHNNIIINQDNSINFNNQSKSSNYFENNENIKINSSNEINDIIREEEKNISKNIINKNNKKEKNFAKKIQEDIERDKLRRKNYIKKMEFIPQEQIINREDIQNEENKEEYFSFYKSNKNSNFLMDAKSLCGIGDMAILNETAGKAVNISFPDQKLLNSSNEMKLFNELQKGLYKFSFEIKNLNQNQTAFIKVGFHIEYITTFDLNYRDENLIKYQKEKIKMGTFGDESSFVKKLFIQKDTDKVYVFININKGKLFIIGENELQKRINNVFLNKENAEIFYVKNFGIIFFYQILSIEPIFEFDENTSKICSIILNEQKYN